MEMNGRIDSFGCCDTVSGTETQQKKRPIVNVYRKTTIADKSGEISKDPTQLWEVNVKINEYQDAVSPSVGGNAEGAVSAGEDVIKLSTSKLFI